MFYIVYVKRYFGEEIAIKATFCRLTSWFTIYTSPRSLTNSLEEFFTVVCLNLMQSDEANSHKKDDKSKKIKSVNYWKFHFAAFVSFVIRSTAAINLIPIYVYHFFYLCNTVTSKLRFFLQFLLMGFVEIFRNLDFGL